MKTPTTALAAPGARPGPVAVPGFGFYPVELFHQFKAFTKDIDKKFRDSTDGNETSAKNQAKCDIMSLLFGEGLVPTELTGIKAGATEYCDFFFDGASCFPATPAGVVRVIPCMESFAGVPYDTSGKTYNERVGEEVA